MTTNKLFSVGLSDSIRNFYEKKSITNSYNFYVDLIFDKMSPRHPSLPITHFITPNHITGVDIPTHTFSRSSVSYGVTQYSFPVLNKEQGLDFKITFEEDMHGNVASFIGDLERTVVDLGLHVAPKYSRLGDIHIYVLDTMKNATVTYVAKDVFFLGAETLSMTYDSNDSVKYSITFGTDTTGYIMSPHEDLGRQRSFSFGKASFK